MRLRRGLAAFGFVAAAGCGVLGGGGGGSSNNAPHNPAFDQLSGCLASFPHYPHTYGTFSGSGGGAGCEGTSGSADSVDKVFAFYSKELNNGSWTVTFASASRTGLIYFASQTDPTLGGWVFIEKQSGGTSIVFTIETDCPCGPRPSPS